MADSSAALREQYGTIDHRPPLVRTCERALTTQITFDKVPTGADERQWRALARIRVKQLPQLSLTPIEGVAPDAPIALALILSTCLAGAAAAQLVPPLNSKPEAYAKATTVPAARDIPFPARSS